MTRERKARKGEMTASCSVLIWQCHSINHEYIEIICMHETVILWLFPTRDALQVRIGSYCMLRILHTYNELSTLSTIELGTISFPAYGPLPNVFDSSLLTSGASFQ
jgi:hypothetical protein